MIKKAILWEKVAKNRVECHVCQRRCLILDGKVGYCKTRLNRGGVLYTLIYGLTSSVNVDPIEKKPVYHYKPGSLCFSLGTFGCNFRCDFCQNWQISFVDVAGNLKAFENQDKELLSPQKAIELALENQCEGIAWTYNEPTIWFEYTLDCAKLAKKKGLYTVYVTNGYMTEEALDMIGPYLDVFRVDIKSMSDRFYKELTHTPSMKGILLVTQRAKEKWNMHIEVVTNIVPGWNDSEKEAQELSSWIHKTLGSNTPWHVTRFYPYGKLNHLDPTPIETLKKIVNIGKDAGLNYVFLGNVEDLDFSNTYCPSCNELLIERKGYHTALKALEAGGICKACKSITNVVM